MATRKAADIKAQRPDSPRYQRQLALAGMSAAAQQKLFDAKVLLLGIGGAGMACAAYLVEAGVGNIVLVDPADVSESDLNEHLLFTPDDVGRPKVEAAKERLHKLNPAVHISTDKTRFDTYNAEKLIGLGDYVVDGLPDWQDKLTASDVCMEHGKILIHAGVRAFEFQVYTMIPGRSACLRCLIADIGMEDVTTVQRPRGVLGPVAGMAGSFQAIEVIKLISGLGTTPGDNVIKFDALRRYVDQIMELGPRPGCPDCDRK